ncbi:hypothetical protein XSR1_120011 [Xenorhabdus szentirmaii DSM 16338]|uniref:Uncharacterized protein n=1 Tax=Xenorhabdus szentirmaii DSM 16338 TaxID=1427518 RepID=W1ITW3_9GAMM|nr:hypothetical protein XSR1_120011 [Xenorhabdus szentirmaii DSM 16338]
MILSTLTQPEPLHSFFIQALNTKTLRLLNYRFFFIWVL